MYLHVGNQKLIDKKDIIGIFDLDASTVSQITKNYLSGALKKKQLESAAMEIPKSFILYKKEKQNYICLSQLSSSVLLARLYGPAVDTGDS